MMYVTQSCSRTEALPTRSDHSEGFTTSHMHKSVDWVAVKELRLSYYMGETLLFTIYTHYGNLI